jgi:hypothetical protein
VQKPGRAVFGGVRRVTKIDTGFFYKSPIDEFAVWVYIETRKRDCNLSR